MRAARRHARERTVPCAGCRKAVAAQQARYRVHRIVNGPKLVPVLGTRRRMQALARMGWPQSEIGRRLGVDRSQIGQLVHGRDMVLAETAEKVAGLYRELAFQVGPSVRSRLHAERSAWPGPMDWADPDNPDEVPACEIEKAHRDALAVDRNWRRTQRRRSAR
jgi:transcriptional regulator with XRE-family HTH domain